MVGASGGAGDAKSVGVGELLEPQAFEGFRSGQASERGIRLEDGPFEGCGLGEEDFSEAEGEGATGEDVVGGVADGGGGSGQELKMGFDEGVGGVPEAGGLAFGEDVEAIVPGAIGDGAEGGQGFLIETGQGLGVVGKAGQFQGRRGLEGFVVVGEEGFVEFLGFAVPVAGGGDLVTEAFEGGAQVIRGVGFAPVLEDDVGEFVTGEAVAEDEAGFADHQFEEVEFILEEVEEVLLEGAFGDEVMDVDGTGLAEAMETADALFDFHGVPGKVEVHQATGELEVTAFGAGAGEEEDAAFTFEELDEGFALGGGGLAVEDGDGDVGGAEEIGEGGLGGEELGENHDAALDLGEGREELAFGEPPVVGGCGGAPLPGGGWVGKLFEATAPGMGAGTGGLEDEAAPEAGLGWGQPGEGLAEVGFPLGPERLFGGGRLEEDGMGAAMGEGYAGAAAGIADHHLLQQAAEFVGFTGLTGAFWVDEALTKLAGGGELAGL